MLAVTKVLLGDPLPTSGETAAPDRSTAKTISDVRRTHASHWKCFQSGAAFVASSPAPHRVPTNVTQRKRKRKDSDGEYTPHQKAESRRSAVSTARRTSKRLATSANLEQLSSATTTSTRSSWSTVPKRSPSSASALTSASSSSFDRFLSPEELDSSDSPAPLFESSNFGEYRISSSVKIGFPQKEKKIKDDHNYSTSTSYRLIEVGDRLRPTPYL